MEAPSHSEDNSSELNSVKGKLKRRKFDKSCDRDVLVSLRRLKIQESLLETAATEALDDQQLKTHLHTLSMKRKKDFDELKKTFHSAKSLFEKLKYNVTSSERVSVQDIEDYKKIAMELDEKIITFKKFLERELNHLREKEKELNTEIQQAEQNMKEINTKLVVKPYTQIVPSSVKTLRNTPSTCPEVQRFQAFLESSGGNRGGWGDQEHSIFVSQWKQLATTAPETAAHGDEASYLEQLIAALAARIPGLTGEEVARHERWYREYARLKGEQQAALNEWRRRRMLLKQLRGPVEESQDNGSDGTVCGSVEKSIKRRPKPIAIKEIGSEAKRLERRIDELQDNSPYKKKQEAVPSLPSELAKAVSNVTTSVHKTERPCHQITPKQCKEKVVIDSWKARQSDTKLILSNLQLGQKAMVISPADGRTGGDAHYATPTKVWTLRKSQGSSGDVKPSDFRLHIPMANSPKLRISDWRRCLVGETHR